MQIDLLAALLVRAVAQHGRPQHADAVPAQRRLVPLEPLRVEPGHQVAQGLLVRAGAQQGDGAAAAAGAGELRPADVGVVDQLADALEARVGHAQRHEQAVVDAEEGAQVLERRLGGAVEVRGGDQLVRGFGDVVDALEHRVGHDGVGLLERGDLGHLRGRGARLPRVDEQERELGEVVEGGDGGRFGVVSPAENDRFPARRDRVVDAAGVPVDAHLPDERPAVDARDLRLRLVRRLIRVRSGQRADLEQQGGAQAHADAGTAAQARADGDRRSQGVDGARVLRRAQREEQVEEGLGGAEVDLAHIVRLVPGHVGEEGLDRLEQLRVEGGDEVVVELLLGRVVEEVPGQVVDVPRVVQVDVSEVQPDGALRLGQRRDVQVRAQRDGGGHGGLAVDDGVLSEDDDLARGRHHEGWRHGRRGLSPSHGCRGVDAVAGGFGGRAGGGGGGSRDAVRAVVALVGVAVGGLSDGERRLLCAVLRGP